MTDTVLILGAGVSYQNLLEAARETEYRIIAIDQNESAPGFDLVDSAEPIDITNVDGALRVAKEYNVSGIVPINDHGVRTAAAVAMELGLPGIDIEVAKTATDKAAMRRQWKRAGVPQPEFEVAKSIDDAIQSAESIGTPLVLKPANSIGGGSRGVSIVDNLKDVKEAFQFAQSAYDHDDRVLIEKQVRGTEHSIEVVIYDGEMHVLAISDKEKTPPPPRVDKSVIYPTASSEREEIAEAARIATKALGIDFGAAHVELGYSNTGPCLFELGARCGGGATASPIVPAATGINYFQELIHIHTGNSPGSLEPKRSEGVTYRFLTPEPGVLERVHGAEEVQTWERILMCEIWPDIGEVIKPVRVGSDRSGAVVSHCPTREEAYRVACEADEKIRFEVSQPVESDYE